MAIGGGSMSRVLGIGFSFGAKDQGATKTARTMVDSFDDLGSSVEKVGKQSKGLQRFGNVMATLNFAQLSNISGTLGDIAEKAGVGPGGQANQIEQFGVTANRSYQQAAAGLGQYRKAVDKHKGAITGVAFNLDVDVGDLTKTVAGIVRTGHSLEDYGLTVRALGGLQQAGIIEGDQLVDVYTSLSEGYGLGAKGASSLVDEMVALGESMGFGADVAKKLPDALKAADAAISALPANMRPSVDDTLKSLNMLALATQKTLGGTFDDAFSSATETMEALTSSRVTLQDTFAGLGGEFPDLAARMTEVIARGGGDVNDAFRMMMKDPAMFVRELQTMYQTLEGTGEEARFLKEIPKSIRFMVTAGAKGAAALDEMRKPVKNFQGAMTGMAVKASGSNRTFGESMEVLEDQFQNRTRRMVSLSDGVKNAAEQDRAVLTRQRKMWKGFGDKIDELRKKGGPMAGFLQLSLDVNRYGLQGLIPTLEKLIAGGGLLGEFADRVRKAVPWLDAMGIGATEAIVGLGALAVAMKTLNAGLQLGGTVFGGFESLVKRAGGWGAVFTGLGNAARFMLGPWGLLAAAVAVAGILIYKNWDVVGPMFKEIWSVLSDGLTPAWEALQPAIAAVKDVTLAFWTNFKEGISIVWNEYLQPFGAWLVEKFGDIFGRTLPEFFGKMTTYFLKGVAILKGAAVTLMIVGKNVAETLVAGWGLLKTLVSVGLRNAFDGVLDTIKDIVYYWDFGFAKMSVSLNKLGLDLVTFVSDIAKSPAGKGFLAAFGMSDLSKDIEDSVKSWTSSYEDSVKKQEAVEADQATRKQENKAREDSREREVVAEQNKVMAVQDQSKREMQDNISDRKKEIDDAGMSGRAVEFRTETALLRRRQEEADEAAKAAAEEKKKKRRRKEGARIAGARPAAAAGGADVLGHVEGLGNIDEFGSTAQNQLEAIATKVMAKANRNRPRPAIPDGVNPE